MTQRFYQVVGYRGHFRPYYWRPHRDFGDNHEFAQEPYAVDAIAGPKSGLWVRTDSQGNEIPPYIELVMGVRPHGAISLLITESDFDSHVKPAMGWTHRTHSCPDPYPTTMYASLSPIRFNSAKELAAMLKDLRPVKAGTRECDDSKLNKYLKEGDLKPERGRFEQARLLWHILCAGRDELPSVYGLPALPPNIRIVYFALTHWIDPKMYEPTSKEDSEVLDFGWYEPGTETTQHYIIEEHSILSKIDKADFIHGESTIIAESRIPNTLRSLLSGSKPIVLVTHDWARTARFLSSQDIDTKSATWYTGVGTLLGFGWPRDRVLDRHTADRRQPSNNRSSNHPTSIEYSPKDEFEHGVKTEGGSSPQFYLSPSNDYAAYGKRERDQRSLSPRSRPRPLERQDRHSRPIFRPDEDEENDGITYLPPIPEVHVLDIRELFIALTPTHRPFVLYPPMANRLGFEVGGWCAGNWARQFSEILDLLVGLSPIHRRIEELRKTPGVAPRMSGTKVPTILEGIAAAEKEEAQPAWGDSSDEEDD
ncbi:hypothetical protein FRC11_006798 [Ceratobasidium sp. 423]|nr:hypothetical protein FRC11_006798 [Ceratobasidium sp. 423]